MAPGHIIERSDFDRLFAALSERGHTTIGPTVRDQAIVYDELRSVADLPVGWTDEQDGGRYRIRRREDEALFGYAVGPHSWKKYQLPPEVKLWEARVDERGAVVDVAEPERPAIRHAFFGARSCELHAMGILDRVLLGGSLRAMQWNARRAPRRCAPRTVSRLKCWQQSPRWLRWCSTRRLR